ncbi:pentatricopeptide repeat-containing protein [Canna indica]|uniref:Pentatricopeptide repeat-containing protein n=1 Tax=Canna indica TaxID=4628 RepID=A0AAQ3L467_9LILI|nr:pentatricopeptide repeat-containing protein [Canna indica]
MAARALPLPPHPILPPPPPSQPPPRPQPRLHPPDASLPNLSTSSSVGQCSPRDVVSWTAAIARHARRGRLVDAADAFGGMLSTGVDPNHVTLVALLSACADFPSSPRALLLGRAIHAQSLKRRRTVDAPEELVVLGTALVDMYAKCGCTDVAREVFDRMPVKNSVSFNTMIAGYMRNGDVDRGLSLFGKIRRKDKISWTVVIDGCVKNGLLEEALDCFRAMQLNKVDADYVTILAVIAACTGLGALGHGLWVHRYVKSQSFSSNIRLSNSLIDMYSRCGSLNFAYQVFESMRERTLVSWNSIIVGFAANGRCHEAIEHFEIMRRDGFEPNGVSFTGVLTACSHAGLVDEGLKFYDLMREHYKLLPRVEHYGCLVDLLSRAGRLEEAMNVVESIPFEPNEVILSSLLAACRVHGDIELAERVMEYLLRLDPESDSNYILLSNIYAAVGRWDGVNEVRNMMKVIGVKKTPGFSSIDIDCEMHEFVAGDRSHPKCDDIYTMLDFLRCEMELCGYVPKIIAGVTDD